MSITIRNLLVRVAPLRPDVDAGKVLLYLRDAALKVARLTYLCQETVSAISVLASADGFTATPSAGKSLLKVLGVQRLDPNDSRYKNLGPANYEAIRLRYEDAGTSTGVPTDFAQDNDGYVWLYPRTNANLTCKCRLAYVPTGDFTTIAMPAEAEDAIVYYCLATLMMHPGQAANMQLSTKSNVLGNMEIAALRSLAFAGQTGVNTALGSRYINNGLFASFPETNIV